MKILLLSHTGSVTGGAEQCLLEYVDVLIERGYKCKILVPVKGAMTAKLTEKKIDHTIVGYGWATAPHRNVNDYRIRASTGNSLAHIFNEVEKYKPDLIITNTAVIPWGLYAGRAFRIPTLLLIHEILNDKDPSLKVLPNYQEYTETLNRNTDFVVYNSEFVKNEFSKGLTLPKTAKHILYPLPPLDEEKINLFYKENKIKKTLTLAAFGVLAPRKNQMEILHAAKVLRSRGVNNFKIDLYGDKTANPLYTRSLRSYIAKNSLKDIVKIKGFATNVYEKMNEYNIILNASTYEPFGRTIVEGQLFGRIVLTNNTGGGPELVTNNTTGLIYRSGDSQGLAEKINWVINNANEARAIGEKAKSVQFNKYVRNDRYNALIEAVEYFSSDNNWANNSRINIYNPLLDLYSYNQQLHHRYARLHRLMHNKVTRKGKHIVVGGLKNIKTKVKNTIS